VSALSSGSKGEKGVVFKGYGETRTCLGWFLVSGDEGFRKSIVFRLDRATEIEKSRRWE
jgi:hypothetical protein